MTKKTQPFHRFYLNVHNGKHRIYVRQYGNPSGVPVCVLHGGPGAAFRHNRVARWIDPHRTHCIVMDQRGCGRSRPRLSFHTADDLVEDIQRLQKHLGIQKWIITGGSWGATLALLFTVQYPERVIGYVLSNGMYGMKPTIWPHALFTMYPDRWETFCKKVGITGEKVRHPDLSLQKKICALYFHKIKTHHASYIETWFDLEDDLLWNCKTHRNTSKIDNHAIECAFYESLYYPRRKYLDILSDTQKLDSLSGIPGFILHGRMDLVCDFQESYRLSQQLPGARFLKQDHEGHKGAGLSKDRNRAIQWLVKKNYRNRNSLYTTKPSLA